MAFSHSMWLNRRSIVVVSVFMMAFLWNVEAMPPDDCSAGGGTDAGSGTDHFASSIDPRSTSAGDRARCVPFHRCCDNTEKNDTTKEQPFLELIDEKTGNTIIDIQAGNNRKCGGKLHMCCRCVEEDTPKPRIPSNNTHQDTNGILTHQWSCGKRNADGVRVRVTGFEEGQTQQGEFPWMAAVMAKDTTFVGGGSLVHPRVVLTAGHKVYQKTPDSLMARIGDWDISDHIESIAPQNIEVETILYHPKFNRQKHEYNVAILILEVEANYGETVAPVCLPEPGQNFNGKNCFVTGWGKDDFGDKGNYQTIMKMVEVPIVDHSRCQTMLRKTRLGSDFVLHSSFTCAGGHKEDACTGDGGSPLVCPGVTNPQELVQVGVVSWGIGCGVEGNPGVYGSVPESMDWVTKTIQDEIGIDVDVRLLD